MNSWSGLKVRKPSEVRREARPLETPGNLLMEVSGVDHPEPAPLLSTEATLRSNVTPGIGFRRPGSGQETPNKEGYLNQGGAGQSGEHALQLPARNNDIDHFGRLFQDWADTAQAPKLHSDSATLPSPSSVTQLDSQSPNAFPMNPPTQPISTSVLAALWQPKQREGAPGDTWQGAHRLPGSNASVGAIRKSAHMEWPVPQAASPLSLAPIASPGSSPAVSPLRSRTPAKSEPQEWERRPPFLRERRGSLPPNLEIAQVLDSGGGAGLGLQARAVVPSFHDFLQLERQKSASPHAQKGLLAASMDVPKPPLAPTGHLIDRRSATQIEWASDTWQRGSIKVPPLELPQLDPDCPPNQPDTPANQGLPSVKGSRAWEDASVPLPGHKLGDRRFSAFREATPGTTGIQVATPGINGLREATPGNAGIQAATPGEATNGRNTAVPAVGFTEPGLNLIAKPLLNLNISEEIPGAVKESAVPPESCETGRSSAHALGAEKLPPGGQVPSSGSAGLKGSPNGSPRTVPTSSELKRAWAELGASPPARKRPRVTEEVGEGRPDDSNAERPNNASVRTVELSLRRSCSNPLGEQELSRQLAETRRQLADARCQLSDEQRQLADARASLEARDTRWRAAQTTWENFWRATMFSGAAGQSVSGRGVVPGANQGGVDEARRTVADVEGVVVEWLSRTEVMLADTHREVGRLKTWLRGVKEAAQSRREGGAGEPAEGSVSGESPRL